MEQDDSSGDRSGQSGYSLKVEPRGFPQLLDVGYERKSRVKYDLGLGSEHKKKEIVINLGKEYYR